MSRIENGCLLHVGWDIALSVFDMWAGIPPSIVGWNIAYVLHAHTGWNNASLVLICHVHIYVISLQPFSVRIFMSPTF